MANEEKMHAVADRCVKAILEDLTDRRGLRQEWEGIDPSIQRQIRKEWRRLIVVVLASET